MVPTEGGRGSTGVVVAAEFLAVQSLSGAAACVCVCLPLEKESWGNCILGGGVPISQLDRELLLGKLFWPLDGTAAREGRKRV